MDHTVFPKSQVFFVTNLKSQLSTVPHNFSYECVYIKIMSCVMINLLNQLPIE